MATMTTAMAAPIRAQIASPWTTPQATAVMSWAPVSSVSRSVRQGGAGYAWSGGQHTRSTALRWHPDHAYPAPPTRTLRLKELTEAQLITRPEQHTAEHQSLT